MESSRNLCHKGAPIRYILLAMLAALLLTSCNSTPERRPIVNETGIVNTAIPTPMAIASSEIYQAYQASQIAFEEELEGRWALVTGEVTSLESTRRHYDVKMFGDGFGQIVCKVDKNIDSQANLAKELRTGDRVAVLGKIGDMGILDIEVKDCTIES